jgi:biotin synthase
MGRMYNESVTAPRASARGHQPELDAEFGPLLDPAFWNRETISFWLQVRGEQQERLFAAARVARENVFGRRVVVRGLIEVTNLCRVNCEFCPMRRDNTRQNTIFQLTEEQILEAAARVRDAGINIVFLQAGEIPRTTQLVGNALPKVRKMFSGPVEFLLCLGNKTEEEYAFLKAQGATSYILKHETSDPDLNQRMRHAPLEERLACLRTLIRLGYKVGTGAIIGLPGQSHQSLVDDLLLAREIDAHMVSGSPFIPAPDTPLARIPPGDVDMTLNFIALARLLNPRWLIPSVSALERRQDGGQLSGLAAGANVLTVNFTPEVEQSRYLIYGKDRYVVRNDHVSEIVALAGLQRGSSVFA